MSEMLILGSGAADWTERSKDGFYRRNAAALVNRELLLDCGSGIWDFTRSFRGALDGVTDVLVTHGHEDHFQLWSLLELAKTRALRIAGDGELRGLIGSLPGVTFIPLTPYVPVEIGRYRVTPVLANHDVVSRGTRRAYHYIIDTPDGKTLLYALDGAWFLCPTWEEMRRHMYDLMVLDCTVGDCDDWRLCEHNTIPMLRLLTRQMRAQKMLRRGGQIVASHFSRDLHGSHEETAHILEAFGVRAAFDGMRIEF